MQSDELRSLVGKNKLSKAIKTFLLAAKQQNDEDLINDLTVLKSRLKELEKNKHRGTLSQESLDVESAKIINSLMFLISDHEAENKADPNQENRDDNNFSTRSLKFRLGLVFLLIIFIPLAFALLVSCPTDFQITIIRTMSSVGLAGLMALLSSIYLWPNRSGLSGGLFALLFLIIYNYQPAITSSGSSCGSFPLTVSLKSVKKKIDYDPVDPGEMYLYLNGEIKKGVINRDGQINFKGISREFQHKEVNLSLELPGWQFAKNKSKSIKVVIEKSDMSIAIEPDGRLSSVFGQVMDTSGKPVPNAQISIKAGQVSIISDSLGVFLMSIPLQWQSDDQVLNVRKKGFELWSKTVYPGLKTEIPVILSPENN